MAREGNGGGGCLKSLIVLVIFLAVVVGGVIFLINQTPDTLGLADKEVYDGKTLRDLGFAEVKIKDVFSLIKSLKNVDETAIVKNAPDEEAEKSKAEDNVEKSNMPVNELGEPNYATLISEPAIYDKQYLVKYDDTTLAYVFNKVAQQATDGGDVDLVFIREINARVDEITITKTGADVEMRVVLSVNTEAFSDQIKENLGAAASLINIPEKIFLVSYLGLSAEADGYVVTEGRSVKINDADNALATAIFKVLASKATEAGAGKVDSDVVNEKLGGAFTAVVKNLGRVGYGAPDPVDSSVATPTYGNVGIVDGGLNIITHTSATVND